MAKMKKALWALRPRLLKLADDKGTTPAAKLEILKILARLAGRADLLGEEQLPDGQNGTSQALEELLGK